MPPPLRILHLEDQPADAERVRAALEEAGIPAEIERVETRADFEAALDAGGIDIVLAGYVVRGLDGISALELSTARRPDVPFVFVTRALGEELAIQTLRRGATDVVHKTHLARLGPAVVRAVAEAAERRHLQLIQEALRESEARFRTMADAAPVMLWVADASGAGTFFNQAWLDFTGRTLEEELGSGWQATVHPEDLPALVALSLQGPPRPFEIEYRMRRADGEYRWVLDRGVPRFGAGAAFEGYIGTCLDVTERRAVDQARAERLARETAARVQAEAAERRAAFLADASAALSSSLDSERTIARLARLAVPRIADWCIIDVLDGGGTARRLAIAHEDPASLALVRELEARYPTHSGLPHGCREVLRSGRSLLVSELSPDELRERAASPAHAEDLARIGLRSFMCVPLIARGRTLGTLTFAFGHSGRSYREDDVAFAEDLARRVALALDNARLYRQSEEASRAKDEFLATVSHELRTPLTALLGWVHLLRGGQLDADTAARGLELIERNTRLQAQLVDDLLDVSRIIAGKLRLDAHLLELAPVIQAAVDTIKPAAEAKEIRLDVRLGPCGLVTGDRDRLQQVVWNLLSNAIKFTPKRGRVGVDLRSEASAAVVEVRDSGEGIPPDVLPHVFERFRQGETGTTRSFGGLGLGLAIVRHLAELHGGTVEAHSGGRGRGAAFVVRLPLASVRRGARPKVDASPAPSRGDDLAGLRVLVVDDHSDGLEMVAAVLAAAGARVATASSARDGFAQLEADRPDVLVSDIGMRGVDGYAFIRRLRESATPEIQRLPALALTAYAREEDRAAALQAGFQDHLAKPVDPEALIAAVGELALRRASGGPGPRDSAV